MREKVINTARDLGLQVQVKRLEESTATVEEAARAVDCEQAQIAKSLVFVADDDPVLAVLSGVDRLDPKRLGAHLGAARVKRADADVVRASTGFPIGGVSPVGHDGTLRILIDRALARFEVVWAAAGTPHAVFPTTFSELLAVTGGETADVRVED